MSIQDPSSTDRPKSGPVVYGPQLPPGPRTEDQLTEEHQGPEGKVEVKTDYRFVAYDSDIADDDEVTTLAHNDHNKEHTVTNERENEEEDKKNKEEEEEESVTRIEYVNRRYEEYEEEKEEEDMDAMLVGEEEEEEDFDVDNIDQELEKALTKKHQKTDTSEADPIRPSKRPIGEKRLPSQPMPRDTRMQRMHTGSLNDDMCDISVGQISEDDIRHKSRILIEIAEFAQNISSKLQSLNVHRHSLTKLHISLIETQTRIEDWKAGVLSSDYLLSKLVETEATLSGLEARPVTSQTPWTGPWDRYWTHSQFGVCVGGTSSSSSFSRLTVLHTTLWHSIQNIRIVSSC